MRSKWRVLIVEDSLSDTKLVVAELRKSGQQIEYERVDDEPSLRACLHASRWDLVLSDWSMPNFSGPAALAVVKELGIDAPFIIVSGTVGEDTAVEAMRGGASDYVLKDRLVRLLPAVERELRESSSRFARRQAEQALARTEEQLRQAQKMEAVGRLAAGIAHDFNNLLSVILGYAELTLAKLKPGDFLRRELEEIDSAASKAAELTRRLLMFSRQQVLELVVLDVNVLLCDLERILHRVLGEDIEFRLIPGAGACLVRADRSCLEQVVMNLVVNARDAMPHGGKLTIETSEQVLDQEYALSHLGVQPGTYVSIVVTDTGVGMDAETQARMFEPFFTTKANNMGTGLGLSTVLGVIQQCQGSIWVYSEVSVGTTFKIFLPAATARRVSTRPKLEPALLLGSETILLVEDDAQVREVAVRILRDYGYQVLEASSAEQALPLCESHPGVIDLLLTDVVMPRVSGPELAAQLLAVRPEMLVLYMSGYTDHSALRHGVLHEQVAYIQKPLTPTGLGLKVRDVLDRASAGPVASAPT
jgi:two-component system cell cycle sensor histidine kinase/response regulator CckA